MHKKCINNAHEILSLWEGFEKSPFLFLWSEPLTTGMGTKTTTMDLGDMGGVGMSY